MAVKCGECGNRERFSAAADLSVELTVNCDGDVVAHDLIEYWRRFHCVQTNAPTVGASSSLSRSIFRIKNGIPRFFRRLNEGACRSK